MRLLFTFFLFLSGLAAVAQVDTTKNDLKEVVVSSSRISEPLRYAPVSIVKLTREQAYRSAAPSFFDALEQVQGVQVLTPSLGFKVLNARGFSQTTNVRFSQLVDGMDSQAPHIGGAIGNALGPTDLDLEQVEVVTGTASALYGMNTVNGLANLISRSAFESPGFSFQQKLGITTQPFTESILRFAHPFSSKFAIKVNASFLNGQDWEASNATDIFPQANSSTGLLGDANPGKDLVNWYGDESPNRRSLRLQGKSYLVSRTGYAETELLDYSISNRKGDMGLFFRPSPNSELSYTYRVALMDNVYQRANRFRLQDYLVQQHGIRYQSPSLSIRAYTNSENTGDSYNLRSMAENIDRSFRSDKDWFALYSSAFESTSGTGLNPSAAHQQARQVADLGRYQPGTMPFQELLAKLQQINNWDQGAALKVKARFYHGELQTNLTELSPQFLQPLKLEMWLGIDHRTYSIGADGNYFVNPVKGRETENILYSKTGGYLSLSKKFWEDKVQVGLVLRADKNDYFKWTSNPRISAVYVPNAQHSFRVGYQEGYRFPSIFEAFANINSGGVKRIGGLPILSTGVFENSYLASSIADFQAAVLRDSNTSGSSISEAIANNKGKLIKTPYTYIEPERIQSVEGGYRGSLLGNRLELTMDVYLSRFEKFIAQVNVNVPKTTLLDSIPFALNEKSLQTPYRVWTNSTSTVTSMGASFGFNFRMNSNWSLMGNATHAKLRNSSRADGLEDGFNTPEWTFNGGLVAKKLVKNLGGGIHYRWQSRYYWQSFLVTDWVPAYGSLDIYLHHTFSKLPLSLKIAGTNLINKKYYSFVAGPQVGRLGMLTLTWNF
jgi:iron complex outermembrane receptor protein